MKPIKKAIILVGHGGLPSDIPQQVVESFMKIHKQRIRSGTSITDQEKELETTIRSWERTPETDPYKAGLEKLASHLKPMVEGYILKTAYNEFCHPSIEEAADELVLQGASNIILVTTMLTPGGSHSEKEIPMEISALQKKYPETDFKYAWPFDLEVFALTLSVHIKTHDTFHYSHSM
jgi:sirohydrochlorin cobaltochelatase